MKCPECGGKVMVADGVHNRKENETYRRKKCTVCGHQFFTVEYEVIQNQRFEEDWADWYRVRNS